MKKTVTINLTVESDFESTIYTAIGDLAAELEDHHIFELQSVEVDDFIEVKTPTLTEGLGYIGRTYNASR